jgi:endonuclease VIII
VTSAVPEGDTLFRTAEVLRAVLAGRPVTEARGRPGGARVDLLRGRTIESVESRGKHLLVHASGGLTLHTHLGMRGSWHRYREGEAWRRAPGDAVAVLAVPGAVAVCFAAPVVEVFDTRALAVHPVLSRLGPDLLAADPELDEAAARIRVLGTEGRTIGDVLLDQHALAGVGNVYRSEVCFLERVNPDTPVEALDDAALGRIVETSRRLLAANRHGPFRTTTGDAMPGAGRDTGRLWVYGRTGRPCRRCGTLIRSQVPRPLARRVYWCPACQPSLTPARRTP